MSRRSGFSLTHLHMRHARLDQSSPPSLESPPIMNLDYVPLLKTQREIQGMPHNRERFLHYLRTIWNCYEEDFELLPLLFANPMARDHVTAMLDELLAMKADEIAADATLEVSAQFPNAPGEFKASVIVCDDLKGGWTNRYDYEFKNRVGYTEFLSTNVNPNPNSNPNPNPNPTSTPTPTIKPPKWSKFLWLTGTLWSSEPVSPRAVREAILTPFHRLAIVNERARPSMLRDILDQEGEVMALAGCESPVLDDDDIAYTREVIAPHLNATDKRTCMECLFGDSAARTLGFTPRGLSPWAGLALALHDARAATHQINR